MYKEYLKSIGVISEEEFNEVINSLPKREICFNDINYSDTFHSKETLTEDLINHFLEDWKYPYLDTIDCEKKILYIDGVQSVKDLEEIKEYFTGWIIEGYDLIKTELEEEERQRINDEKRNTLKHIIIRELDILDEQDLKEIVNHYVNKK